MTRAQGTVPPGSQAAFLVGVGIGLELEYEKHCEQNNIVCLMSPF